ncbi:lipase family protein [Phanerochaete sordida]|uniref:Lipase family protein n=1 Tax=Phanerochaete sordida TaxID=48140 RepID=A0A9P3FY31_9APHY|nr:lipase family protein [Phanerochaete sordida]
MLSFSFLPFVCALLPLAQAAPLPLFGINFGESAATDGATSSVSQSTINSTLQRPGFFARAAYCETQSLQALTCGAPCDAISKIKILQAGGDGGEIPRFFVAQDPDSQTIVVAHQGTDPTNLLSDLNDVEVAQVAMNSTRFPSAAKGSLVHDGFQDTQGRTADLVLSTVKAALASSGYTRVLATGHSLGAAVATLDATMLRMQLPASVEVDSVVFGLPRVGNQPFADMIDALLPSFSHVTNQHDPVPDVPPRFLSFQHPAGELHITAVDAAGATATMVECPGQENSNCSEGNSLLDASVGNHLGPYFDGISFGSTECSA